MLHIKKKKKSRKVTRVLRKSISDTNEREAEKLAYNQRGDNKGKGLKETGVPSTKHGYSRW